MNHAIFDAFTAGFNAARSIDGDNANLKQEFENAWKIFVAAQTKRDEAKYRKANRKTVTESR